MMDQKEEMEIKRYKNWINTMKIDSYRKKNYDLIEECKNLLLLEIFDYLEPGIINWKIIEKNPNNKYRKLANFNHFFSKINEKNVDYTSIGSNDLVEGKKGKILSILWSLMRYNYFKDLEEEQKVSKIDEDEIEKWAEKFNKSVFKLDSREELKDIKNEEKVVIFKKQILSLIDKHDDILPCDDRELFLNEIIKEDFGMTINLKDLDINSFENSHISSFNNSFYEKDLKKIEIISKSPSSLLCLNKFQEFDYKLSYKDINHKNFCNFKTIQPLKKIFKTQKMLKDVPNILKCNPNLFIENIEKSKNNCLNLKKNYFHFSSFRFNYLEKGVFDFDIKKDMIKIKKHDKSIILDTLKEDLEDSVLLVHREYKKKTENSVKISSNSKKSILLSRNFNINNSPLKPFKLTEQFDKTEKNEINSFFENLTVNKPHFYELKEQKFVNEKSLHQDHFQSLANKNRNYLRQNKKEDNFSERKNIKDNDFFFNSFNPRNQLKNEEKTNLFNKEPSFFLSEINSDNKLDIFFNTENKNEEITSINKNLQFSKNELTKNSFDNYNENLTNQKIETKKSKKEIQNYTAFNNFFIIKNNLSVNNFMKKKIYKLLVEKKWISLKKIYIEEFKDSKILPKISKEPSIEEKIEKLNNISQKNKLLFPLILQRKLSLKNKKIEEVCQVFDKIEIVKKKNVIFDCQKIEDIVLLKPYCYKIVLKKLSNKKNEKICNFPKTSVILKEFKNHKSKFANFKDYLDNYFI